MRWRGWLILLVGLCAGCGPSVVVPSMTLDDIAAERRRQEIAQLRDYYAQLRRLDTVAYRIRTANREFCKKWLIPHIIVKPVVGCAIPVNLDISPEPNASTDYKQIIIQSGILRLPRSEADLAAIVGHELAHVTMSHYQKKTINGFIGQAGGLVVDGGFLVGGIWTGGAFSSYLHQTGLMAFSVAFEMEADYVGAYYAARAGYDISGAAEIWRAMSLENPASIRMASDHPTTPVRYIQMQKTIEEIADKKRHGVALLPEMKVNQANTEPAPAPAREVNN